MKNETYSQEFTVANYDVSANGNYRLTAFLKKAQEAAQGHASILGYGYDDLCKMGLIWVISRMEVEVIRYPKWREEVTIRTWHKGKKGLYYLRDYEIVSADGERLILATSSWLILDTVSRRIQRNVEGMDEIFIKHDSAHHAIQEPCSKIKRELGEVVSKHGVSYSDIDMNLHANNSKYLEWALDILPHNELTAGFGVKLVKINFAHESLLGDIVDLALHKEGSTYYVHGIKEEKDIFSCLIDVLI